MQPDYPTKYWHSLDQQGRVQCDLCPRFCRLKPGQRGFCFVRANHDGKVVLTSYGRSSGFQVDPIEKKPLNHFLPGSKVFSFGTAGCNLGCKFCQNWDISKSRQMDTLAKTASPQQIAQTAGQLGCASVAYTYNDPVIFHEYAIDCARACRELGIRSVAVSAGYVCPEPRAEFYQYMDAVNIDLKAFSDDFYVKMTGSHLQPVLETLEYIVHNTSCHLEVTTLLIPGKNDSVAELEQMTLWIREHLGVAIPLHFSAYHPAYKTRDIPSTPAKTLVRSYDIARANGLRYVYLGNVHDKKRQSTYCHNCGQILIGRDWYQLSERNVNRQGQCLACGAQCAGVWS